jgi:hypothetical protein
MKTSFQLGFVSMTPAASAALAENGYLLPDLLNRHASGDCGDVAESQRKDNEIAIALKDGGRVFSAYLVPNSHHLFYPKMLYKVWIITEAAIYALNGIKRITTTVLMPDDYLEYNAPVI